MSTNQHSSQPRLILGAILAFAVGTFCSDASGQSITAPGSIAKVRATVKRSDQRRLPNPIRQADHTEPLADSPNILPSTIDQSAIDSGNSIAESSWGIVHDLPINALRGQPTHAHRVIRAPSHQPPGKQKAARKTSKKHLVHPPYSSHRRRVQPAPAMLPGGKERESWKSPYSYGYFGASGTRHWSLHHGYRDRYTEWRLK